jgi:hypothetical protein
MREAGQTGPGQGPGAHPVAQPLHGRAATARLWPSHRDQEEARALRRAAAPVVARSGRRRVQHRVRRAHHPRGSVSLHRPRPPGAGPGQRHLAGALRPSQQPPRTRGGVRPARLRRPRDLCRGRGSGDLRGRDHARRPGSAAGHPAQRRTGLEHRGQPDARTERRLHRHDGAATAGNGELSRPVAARRSQPALELSRGEDPRRARHGDPQDPPRRDHHAGEPVL